MQPFFLNQYCCEELMARLEFLTLQPKIIWMVGEEDDYAKKVLQMKYPNANILLGNPRLGEDKSIDLIFANLILVTETFKNQLMQWERVLSPAGVIAFSALGPDTLKELSENAAIMPYLIDMHDLGDALVKARLADPVLDVEIIAVTYRSLDQLKEEMEMGKMIDFQKADVRLPVNVEGLFELTFECVFGHAFGKPFSHEISADDGGVVRIPLAHLRRRR